MTTRILVVDDEADLETLILQKFRHQVRDGVVSFLFARDGLEALDALKANNGVSLVVTDINMPRMDGLPAETSRERGEALNHHRVGLWRHGQYPHRDEPRCV
jgi:CheY-like chemotaxis protein